MSKITMRSLGSRQHRPFSKEEMEGVDGTPMRIFFALMKDAGIAEDAADLLLTNLLVEFDEIERLDSAESEACGRLWELWPEYVR
jgi:hypothetical protein